MKNESASSVSLRPMSDWRFGKVFGEWCIIQIEKVELKSSNSNKNDSVNIKGIYYQLQPDAFINKYTLTFFSPWSFKKVKGKFENLYEYFPKNIKDKSKLTTVNRMNGAGYWRESEVKARHFDSVFLPSKVREAIINSVEKFYDSEDWYIERGLPYRRGILLYGAPGNGKTSIAAALAAHTKKNLYYLNLSGVKSDEQLLEYMRNDEPGIILMEDIDCVDATERRDDDKRDDETIDFGVGVTLSGLLNAIDGVLGQDGNIILMTTNHPEKLDPALVRPGRIDLRIEIKNACKEQLVAIFTKFFPERADLAEKFAENVGEEKWPMCAIQNHLVIHSDDPETAALGKIDEHSNREF